MTTYTTITDPLGKHGTDATGVNNNDDIVGHYSDSNFALHGFLDIDGTFTTIDDPRGTGGTEANGINDSGEIVGTYWGSGTSNGHGFVDIGGQFTTVSDPLGSGPIKFLAQEEIG